MQLFGGSASEDRRAGLIGFAKAMNANHRIAIIQT